MAAADELAQGSLEEAERYLGLAARRKAASVPAGRRGQAQLLLGVVRLLLARQRGNLPAVAEEARRLQALAEAPDAAQPGLGEELRALALISLGITEFWAAGSRRQSGTWSRASRWRAGSGGRFWSSLGLAHQHGDRDLPVSPYARRPSAAGRRSNWPSGTAGPTSRPPASPT